MIKPISGLFLVFWGAVKVIRGFVLFDGGEDLGAAVMLFGILAAAVWGLLHRGSFG